MSRHRGLRLPFVERVCLILSLLPPSTLRAQSAPSAPPQGAALQQQFKLAVAAYDAGHFPQAAATLETMLPQAASSFEVQELLGLSYGAQSRDARALEHLDAAVRLNPGSAAAHTNLATALVRAGKATLAEAQLKKALELDPSDYNANHNLAELRLREGRVPDAVAPLEAAQRSRPSAYDNGYDLALAYVVSSKLPEARQLVNTLQRQHDSGELHTLLGRIDEQQGKFLEAANEFSAAAHMDPSEETLFVWASELLLHRTYEPAIEVFRDATQRYPKSARLWIGLGMALYSRGEYEDAVRSLLIAADLDPRDARCYLFLSKAYLSSPGQAPEVIERFRRYAALEPANATAQYDYAMSLWKGRRAESADVDYKTVEALLKRAIALDGSLAEAHLQLGILYTDEHQYDAALPEYQRTLQLNPGLADAHFRLARYYLHAGDKANAEVELATFKKLQAEHQAEVDKERAEVQQFVVAHSTSPAPQP